MKPILIAMSMRTTANILLNVSVGNLSTHRAPICAPIMPPMAMGITRLKSMCWSLLCAITADNDISRMIMSDVPETLAAS